VIEKINILRATDNIFVKGIIELGFVILGVSSGSHRRSISAFNLLIIKVVLQFLLYSILVALLNVN